MNDFNQYISGSTTFFADYQSGSFVRYSGNHPIVYDNFSNLYSCFYCGDAIRRQPCPGCGGLRVVIKVYEDGFNRVLYNNGSGPRRY